MIDDLPIKDTPNWLIGLSQINKTTPVPLADILKNSLYYPSSGFDGDPVKYLSGNFYSFIYVDYGNTADELDEQLENMGFNGYHIVFSRNINENELAPNGWSQTKPINRDTRTIDSNTLKQRPFAKWIIFQRAKELNNSHGAERFSLLYICAEAVAAFHALYISNNSFPLGIAIIQPGYGFGGNWTNFEDPRETLAKTVLNNPAGKPKVLIYGGMGKRTQYTNSCWPRYSKHIRFLEKFNNGSIGIWLHQ